MWMRFKVGGLILLSSFLVLCVLVVGEAYNLQRVAADLLQLGRTQTIQNSSIETDELALSVTDNQEEVQLGEEVVYTISWKAKKEIKKARLVAALGQSKKEIYPFYSWELGDLKAGQVGYFEVPVTIEKGEINLVVSRVTLSQLKQSSHWLREKREIVATVDDVDNLVSF